MSFDLSGAANDLSDRARRYAPIYADPAVADVVKLVHRNPWVASSLRTALDAHLAAHPDKAVGLEVPLFDAAGRLTRPLRRPE